ncbi:TPA: hypothetical protein N0F65_006121 [Lagenidium giganteum]|uniref:Uncharacterized protein n=1 Tax=Lagenidium giganteum TaxID=4803 RepID=A0AAV2Z3E5_9STRA|nr:TPA: hypothetical protein N0F65_006121 [Lagenidium giganteum]
MELWSRTTKPLLSQGRVLYAPHRHEE